MINTFQHVTHVSLENNKKFIKENIKHGNNFKIISREPRKFRRGSKDIHYKVQRAYIYDVLKELMIIAKDYSENTEYPAIQARTKKNMFDAYINVGFTENQALALMINDNIQLMKNIQKSVNNTSVKKSK